MSHEQLPIIESESSLPKLPPDQYFTDPFYANIAKAFWNVTDDPNRIDLTDQLLFVIEPLGPQERLNVVKTMWHDMLPFPEDERGNTIHIWGHQPERLNADENTGEVYLIVDNKRTVVGNANQLETYFRDYYIQDKALPAKVDRVILEEEITERIMAAFENYKGETHGNAIQQKISDEICRRMKLIKKDSMSLRKLTEKAILGEVTIEISDTEN